MMPIVTFTVDLPKQQRSIFNPLTVVNMSAKFDEEAQRFSLYPVHKLISTEVLCDLDLWC